MCFLIIDSHPTLGRKLLWPTTATCFFLPVPDYPPFQLVRMATAHTAQVVSLAGASAVGRPDGVAQEQSLPPDLAGLELPDLMFGLSLALDALGQASSQLRVQTRDIANASLSSSAWLLQSCDATEQGLHTHRP